MNFYGLSDADLSKQIHDKWKKGRETQQDWRKEAKEDFNFAASHQWDEQDIAKMQAEQRPMVTFNRCNVIISSILGMEANQRNETAYFARENADSMLSDAVSAVADWVQEYGEFEQEDAQAFEDMLTCGMGWSETRMDYETDLDGKILRETVSPFEMAWDTSARKRNLADASWIARGKRMTLDEIKENWPKAEDFIAAETFETEEDDEVDFINRNNRYAGNASKDSDSKTVKPIVIQFQWYEKTNIIRTVRQDTGKFIELPDKKDIQDKLDEDKVTYAKQPKRVYYQAFAVGSVLLEKSLSPCQTGFTFKCITGKRDMVNNQWYGLMRLMKDPQRWANKFLSSFMDIINSNSKGGVMYEEGSVRDIRKFEDNWSKADSAIPVANGALSGGRIEPKPDAKYPQAVDRLLQFAISSVYDVSGVNLELLGMTDRDQPGVVEETRKKSAYTILAPFFDSYRAYRKSAGITLLEYITKFLPVPRIYEVLEDKLKPIAEQVKSVDLKQINVVVAESPQSDNNKQFVWAFAAQIIPSLIKMGIPVPPEILDYTPLPAALVETWKQTLNGGAGNPQAMMAQMKQQMGQMQQMMAQMQQENAKLKIQENVRMKEAQDKKELSVAEFELKKAETVFDMELKQQELQNKLVLERIKTDADIALEKEKVQVMATAGGRNEK